MDTTSREPGSRVVVADRPEFAAALLADGAVLIRHARLLRLDLAAADTGPEHRGLVPLDRERTDRYGELLCRSYPPSHPDHEPGDDDPVAAACLVGEYLRGEHVGPWIEDASWEAMAPDGAAAGMVIVSRISADEWQPGGPWVTDLAVDPGHTGRGLGGALVCRAAASLQELGEPQLGLAVTAGNPAWRLYERLGFVVMHEIWRLEWPAEGGQGR